MKLGELAAKLNVSPSDIVDYLTKHEAQIAEDADTDLEDEHIAKVSSYFVSVKRDNLLFSLKQDESTPNSVNNVLKKHITTTPQIEVAEQTAGPDVPETKKKMERIKVPKVALPGLKVVGKIALPTAKTKAEESDIATETSVNENAPALVKQEEGKSTAKKKRNNIKPRKTPATLQSTSSGGKRHERSGKGQAQQAQRYHHYNKKVNSYSTPIKPLRKELSTDYEVYEEEKEVQPKNWLSRLLHWLTASS